jgi:hypothetical protein
MILQHKQIDLSFLNILISYLYFSELKWNSYDFSKIQTFSGILIAEIYLYIPAANLPQEADMWGPNRVKLWLVFLNSRETFLTEPTSTLATDGWGQGPRQLPGRH